MVIALIFLLLVGTTPVSETLTFLCDDAVKPATSYNQAVHKLAAAALGFAKIQPTNQPNTPLTNHQFLPLQPYAKLQQHTPTALFLSNE